MLSLVWILVWLAWPKAAVSMPSLQPHVPHYCLLCALMLFAPIDIQHTTHQVSVPIRHPRDKKLCSQKLRDRHTRTWQVQDTRYVHVNILMHVASRLFSWSTAAGLLAFSSRQFARTINHGPLSASHIICIFHTWASVAGANAAAERSALYYVYVGAGLSVSPEKLPAMNECRMQYILGCHIFSIILTAVNSGRGWHNQLWLFSA